MTLGDLKQLAEAAGATDDTPVDIMVFEDERPDGVVVAMDPADGVLRIA